MKSLKECLATPLDTTGMGNPMPPTDTNVGSEPMDVVKPKKKLKNVSKKADKKSI